MAEKNESVLENIIDDTATDPIRTQVEQLFASQGIELTEQQLSEAEEKAKEKVTAMIQNQLAETLDDTQSQGTSALSEEAPDTSLSENAINSFGAEDTEAPSTQTSSVSPQSGSPASNSSSPSPSSDGLPVDTMRNEAGIPTEPQPSSQQSSPRGTNAKRPKGLASRWGDKEWQQMSDSLKDGEDETKKEEEKSEEKKDTQTQAPTPGTDEQIAKENEGEASSNTSKDTPQAETRSESNEDSPAAQKTQAEELQRQKNAEQSQIEQAEINRLQQEEVDQAQNQAIAGQAQQKQQEEEEKKDDTPPSFMVKWLHGIRGWNGIGIITLLPVILFPGILVAYVVASIVLEFALYRRGFVEAMVNTIKLPSAVQTDFTVMFGGKKPGSSWDTLQNTVDRKQAQARKTNSTSRYPQTNRNAIQNQMGKNNNPYLSKPGVPPKK
ncbi:MAG: hypothetical protein KBD15_02245 [Candidatus Magasanikbacteria bacterium]|jgi:hypothetical protein|nr:hypothetical protein [Candidatus Magasanikbacteria bacterium]